MVRCSFALEKMRYDAKFGMVIYRSKLHATLKRNYQLRSALKWLRLLMNHIPDKSAANARTSIQPRIPCAVIVRFSMAQRTRTVTVRHGVCA